MTLFSLGRQALLASAALCAVYSTPLLAQDTLAGGFSQTAQQPLPVAFSSYSTLPSGDRVVFDGLSFDLYDAAGGFLLNLGLLPAFVFNSFVAVDPSGTFAVAGESSNGDIFRVALDGSGYTIIGNLGFNFDAVFEDANTLLISAATCGFSCGNDIVRMDASSGATTFLANLPGASGPLAMETGGDLLYGKVEFGVPGGTDLLRFTAAQLNGGTLLTEADASLLVTNLEGAASLAVDPVFGNVFLAESIFGATSRVLEFDPGTGALLNVVVESASWLSDIELMDAGGIGHFHAYQPSDGIFMHYNNGDIVSVRPQRPSASLTQQGSVAVFQVQDARPNSALLVLFSSASLYDPNYITYHLNGMDFLFHTVVPVFQLRRTPLLIPTDANGNGSFSFFDPGNLAGTLVFQALITDETGKFIGSSTGALN